MKISFDFDRTLERHRIKNLAINLYYCGHEIWIVTRRGIYKDTEINRDVFDVAQDCIIPKSRIKFCDKNKYHYLKDFDIHFDDDKLECELINEHTNCKAILI